MRHWTRDRYRDERALAPGVALAVDRVRPSARRVLKWADEPARAPALATERDRLLALTHPCLRRLEDAGEGWVALEHVAGRPLDVHLRERPDDAARLTVELLRGIGYLHARGFAHGDLKPANVLVDEEGRARVIDLGLTGPLGEPPRGGTRPFLAPEYTAGGGLSVAGDLYALGHTLAGIPLDEASPLGRLAAGCRAARPEERPASVDVALAALGSSARPVDRHGRVPLRRRASLLAALEGALRAQDGQTHWVAGGEGAGRTRLTDELRRWRLTEGRADIDLPARDGAAPWLRLGELLGAARMGSVAERIASAVASLAARGVGVVCDGLSGRDTELADGFARAASALRALGRGCLVVVGGGEALGRAWRGQPITQHALEELHEDDARAVLRAYGVRASAAQAREASAIAAGRAGTLARLAERAAERPTLAMAEIARSIAPAPVARPAGLEEIGQWLEEGRVGAARSALTRLAPSDAAGVALWVRAEADAGDLEAATRRASEHPEALPAEIRVEVAFWLERLGRYQEAADWADAARAQLPAEHHPRLGLVGAMAALALGDLTGAEARLDGAGDAGDELGVRLSLVRSDLALRRADAAAASRLAEAAAELARSIEEPSLIAQAEARRAAAAGLGGRAADAKEAYTRALAAAERAGDVRALPAYVVNLATSEHALGELDGALRHYEEAARLAQTLRRPAIETAARVNHAGLLVAVGAADDARPILAQGAELAGRTGLALFEAQSVLIRAELEAATGAIEDGRRSAEEAKERFEHAQIPRQALEAELLAWELGLDADPSAAPAASAFVEAHRAALRDAGLEARATLLCARAEAGAERWGPARELATDAERIARESSDRLLAIRACSLVAQLDERTGAGSAAARGRRDEHVRAVAAHLPPGLRERFVARHPPAHAPAAAPRATDDGLPPVARRLVALTRRVLLQGDERALLTDALDEAITLTGAERAFLLRRKSAGRGDEVLVARNLDGEALRRRRRSFSRSVADRVVETGEVVLTAAAADDPALSDARSIVDLGVRSILCVPIRAPSRIIGALYLDHRFEVAQFSEGGREVVQAVADVIGLALENARLHREAEGRAEALERAHEAVSRENERRAVQLERLEGRLAERGRADPITDAGVVGRSRDLRIALGIAKRVARSDLPVLLEGESGTGKELFARLIHERSLRAAGPLLSINCGAVPDALLESELFGHVRGAFTGALRDHPGLFRAAEGGTVLLDEIGEMPARMQTRLLRVLQEREVRPVGAERPVAVDVRVIAATNRTLEAEVRAGRFRRDLYFRLVGARLELPPLRQRPEDIPLLAEHALAQIADEPGMRRVSIDEAALRRLSRHEWPGNVRELQQTLRRAVLMSEGDTLGADDLALVGERVSRRRALREFDRELVSRALRAAGGNRSRAARELGISRMTLYRWIARYEL